MINRHTEYGPKDLEQVSAVIWEAVFGMGEPTTPLSRQLAADRAARWLAERGWLADPDVLPSAPRLPAQKHPGTTRVVSSRR